MKKARTVLLCCAALALGISPALADEQESAIPLDLFEPPAEGKAVVYFFLSGKTPAIPSVSLMHDGARLPILLGAREYFRYECDPGFHTFSIDGKQYVAVPSGWGGWTGWAVFGEGGAAHLEGNRKGGYVTVFGLFEE